MLRQRQRPTAEPLRSSARDRFSGIIQKIYVPLTLMSPVGQLPMQDGQSNSTAVSYCFPGDYGMTAEDRERMECLCKRIAVEKNPLKIETLALELNDLVSATLKSVQPKPKCKSSYRPN